jgi:hypothetical protein
MDGDECVCVEFESVERWCGGLRERERWRWRRGRRRSSVGRGRRIGRKGEM